MKARRKTVATGRTSTSGNTRERGAASGTRKKARPAVLETRAKPKLLSGGNPQIAMSYGAAAVREYIAAMPGWKRDVGARLDALITRAVPGVRRAVKWNSPFYGVAGQGWFLAFHCFTAYVKVTFFRGASLQPPPPEPSKDRNVRYLHVREHDALDEHRLARWILQAAKLPGWVTADIRDG